MTPTTSSPSRPPPSPCHASPKDHQDRAPPSRSPPSRPPPSRSPPGRPLPARSPPKDCSRSSSSAQRRRSPPCQASLDLRKQIQSAARRKLSIAVCQSSLPRLADTAQEQQDELFLRKLEQCRVLFNFDDPLSNLREKEVKRACLTELIDYIAKGRSVLSSASYQQIGDMVRLLLRSDAWVERCMDFWISRLLTTSSDPCQLVTDSLISIQMKKNLSLRNHGRTCRYS